MPAAEAAPHTPQAALPGGAAVPAAMQRADVPLLALLTLAHVVVDAYATTVPALLPFWQDRFHLTYGLAGLITGIANVTSSVAQPVVGVVTDRGRNPRWIVLACLVAAAGISATGLAPGYPLFLALVVIGGLGVSGFHPQGYKLVGLYSGARQAVATSWFLVGGNVGVALGPLLGTALALRYGPEGTAWLFIPGALFAATLWVLLPRWTGRSGRSAGAGNGTGHGQTRPPPAIARLGLNRRLAAVAVLVAAVAVRSTVTNSLNSFVPLFLVGVSGADKGFAGRTLSGMLLAGALATVAGGYLADRWGRLRVFAGSLVPVPLLLLAFVALGGRGVLAIGALWLAGALLTASFSVTVVLAQELWYERRALASGVIVGFAFGVGGLFVPAVGVVADTWGLPLAFQAIALLPLVVFALIGALSVLLRPSGRK